MAIPDGGNGGSTVSGIQAQINRISGAVSAALATLTEKGVTVPDGTKIDGLAALIAAIEAGGGGSGGGNVNAFLRTFAENTSLQWLNFEHNSGFVPTFIAVVRADYTTVDEYELGSLILCRNEIGLNSFYAAAVTLSKGTETYASFKNETRLNTSLNNETTTQLWMYTSSKNVKAGIPYLFLFANVEV